MTSSEFYEFHFIKWMKERLVISPTSVNGPYYHSMNKQLADFYFERGEELKGIYHLTEAHAANLRMQTIQKFNYKDDQIKNPPKNQSLPVAHGLHKKYVEFEGEIFSQEEKGLLSRLQEMPSEWTVVQLTKRYNPQPQAKFRSKNTVFQPSHLHITRLPCGASLEERHPVSVLVDPPRHSEGMPTLYELMHKATVEYLRTKDNVKLIKKNRDKASEIIKSVVEDLSLWYLREWKCLLLGTLCNSEYAAKVKSTIDEELDSDKHKTFAVERRSRELLYYVAGAAVYLSEKEIESAVLYLVTKKDVALDIIRVINTIKEELSILMVAQRHPVILILDEELDTMPWEVMPILKRQPVSRVPSIHFLHALYHEHKDYIVNGCRLIDRLDLGYYIINPDEDLKNMEERLMEFLKERIPEWTGIKGTKPSEDEICNALVEKSVYLYCGHFNGTQFMRPDHVSNLRVVALPLLFGCASVALQDLGGRAHPTGISDQYIMSGCACVLGMLWTVTNDDTDCMTAVLLNNWLPGEPIDLSTFRYSGDILPVKKQPELLRLLRHAREVAKLFTNSAALVARGIPVRMKEQ